MPVNPEVRKKYQPPQEVRPEHKEFLIKVGTKLKDLREQRNLSISQLAKMLGISRNAYSEWEKGRVYCNILSLLQILDFYEVRESFFKQL